MRVKELIKKLQTFPQELNVYYPIEQDGLPAYRMVEKIDMDTVGIISDDEELVIIAINPIE